LDTEAQADLCTSTLYHDNQFECWFKQASCPSKQNPANSMQLPSGKSLFLAQLGLRGIFQAGWP